MQVTQTPSLVISHIHRPIVMLQQHTMVPFIMQQRLHFELAIIEHRFWSMLHAILSSHEHMIFMPPLHFSIFMVQRGIIMPAAAWFIVGMAAPIPIPDIMPSSVSSSWSSWHKLLRFDLHPLAAPLAARRMWRYRVPSLRDRIRSDACLAISTGFEDN